MNVATLERNRWLVVIGALLIQLALGAIYAWSVFTPALTKEGGDFGFTATQTQWIFSLGLATFAVFTIIGGRLQAKLGPRPIAALGGLCLGLGYVLAGLIGQTFMAQLLLIGLLGGMGIGFAYVCPIAVGIKWYPDKKGLITGLAVAGFGFGATLWVLLAGDWGHLLETMGVLKVFLVYGIAFFVLVQLGSLVMVNPRPDWTPAGWTPAQASAAANAREFTSTAMLKTGQFYGLWLSYVAGALAGLMVIGIIKLFGADALQAKGSMTAEQAAAAATLAAGVFLPLGNGIGRLVWGGISDRIGRKNSLVLAAIIQAVVMFAFFFVGGVPVLLFIATAIVGFNFGGNLALFPVMTADFFGPKSVGQNYGWMFTAYGVGGIVGPIMAGMFKDAGKAAAEAGGVQAAANAWLPAFLISGALCVLAAVILFALRPPKVQEEVLQKAA
ncbi:MAG: OFA family MFS transporter [Fimbriimonadia bacterium]|jgi:MFS family permease